MSFTPQYAKEVALPSAILLAEYLAEWVPPRVRKRLVAFLTEYIASSILAAAEFQPPELVPPPSAN